jgi:hypothetical protein
VVVTAVVFVYLGPFLTLLALLRERDEAPVITPVGKAAVEGATA